MNDNDDATEPKDEDHGEAEQVELEDWTGFDELLSKFKPKDIKELVDKFFDFMREKALKEAQSQAAQKQLQIERELKRAKLIIQYQWIRAVLLVLSGAAVTFLILNSKFDSAAALFFGGMVAYLFGKEPK